MYKIFFGIILILITPHVAFAGIDETINNITAPIAALVGQLVFFKISVFWGQLASCGALACGRRCVFHVLHGICEYPWFQTRNPVGAR